MGLSTKFCLPDASFDPYKYAPKAVRVTQGTKPLFQPFKDNPAEKLPSEANENQASETMAKDSDDSVGSTSHSAEAFSDSEIMPEPAPDSVVDGPEDTTSTIEATSDQDVAGNTISSTEATIKNAVSDREKNIEQFERMIKTMDKIERHVEIIPKLSKQIMFLTKQLQGLKEFQGDQSNGASLGVKTEDTSIVEKEVENPTSPEQGEADSTEVDFKDTINGPPTLITAEHLSLEDIPPPEKDESFETPSARRLISIRRVRNIRPVKVDNMWLTVAQVDGWTCSVPRHAFKDGDLVVFVMIDAYLPASDKRFGQHVSVQTYNGVLGHRVKTQRFGTYPNKLEIQGMIFPLERFAEINAEIEIVQLAMSMVEHDTPTQEGMKQMILAMYRHKDWAEELKVTKWVEPGPVQKPAEFKKLGGVPTRVFRKTDISHLEDCPNLFTKPKYNFYDYQESVKLDGASMSVYFVKSCTNKFHDLNPLPEGELGSNMALKNGRFGVCSKNNDLHELAPCHFGYWKVALLNDLPAKLAKLNRNIAIQGEICGPAINQNREKLDKTQFYVYAMWDIDAQKYLEPGLVEKMAYKLGLQHVPVIRYVRIRSIAGCHNDLRRLADERPGEGLVYKCVRDGRSFKVHSPAYKVRHNC